MLAWQSLLREKSRCCGCYLQMAVSSNLLDSEDRTRERMLQLLSGLRESERNYWPEVISTVQEHGTLVANVAVQPSMETALHFAAVQGKPDYCGLLLSRGALPNAKTVDEGWTPLHHCADPDGGERLSAARAAVADVLLIAGADVDARDDAGETPLFHAARYADSGLVHVLLKHGAAVNIEDYSAVDSSRAEQYTPLTEAVFGGSVDVVRTLVEHGADFERNECGESLQELAKFYNRQEVLVFLQSLQERQGRVSV